jgi:hypothetical protein
MPERQRSDASTGSSQQPRQQSRQQGLGLMPMAPTDSLQPEEQGALGLLQPPTRQPTSEDGARPAPAQADQGYGAGGVAVPLPRQPTYRRPSSSHFGGGGLAPRSSGGMQQFGSQLPGAPVEKAFSDYRSSSSGGYSPWMQLFRTDTNRGTIDNYSSYVRPALDQRNMNQQFNMDIYGLQRNSRIQNSAIQQLGRGNSRSLQGVGTPQYNTVPGGYPAPPGQ